MGSIKGEFKIRYVVPVIFILVFLWTQGLGIVSFQGIGTSAKEAITSRFNNELNIWKLKIIISDINIDRERKLVFFENCQDGIMTSYLKKNWVGMWKVIDTVGETPKENKYKNVSLFGGDFKDKYIYGGCIYEKDVCKVKLCGYETTIVDQGKIKFWYIVNNEDIAKNIIELELYDLNGNKIIR